MIKDNPSDKALIEIQLSKGQTLGVTYFSDRKRASLFLRDPDDGVTILATMSGRLETLVFTTLLSQLFQSQSFVIDDMVEDEEVEDEPVKPVQVERIETSNVRGRPRRRAPAPAPTSRTTSRR